MTHNEDHRIVIKGHGVKGKWYDVELEAFQDPTMLANVDGKTCPSHGHVHIMFQLCVVVPYWQEMAIGLAWKSLQE
jgi:hypothetical protein